MLSAEEIFDRLRDQPIRDYDGTHEYYRPRGSMGDPGKLVVMGYSDGNLDCEVTGWGCTVRRPLSSVILPRGLTRAHLVALAQSDFAV